jgi:hypothetical protein
VIIHHRTKSHADAETNREERNVHKLAHTILEGASWNTHSLAPQVMPGQALAYKVGEIEILRLKDLAQRQLGDHFSYAGRSLPASLRCRPLSRGGSELCFAGGKISTRWFSGPGPCR